MKASWSRPVHGTRPSQCGSDGSSPGQRARSAASGPGTSSFGSENALVSAPGKTASRGTRPLPVSGRVVVHCGAASMGVIPGSGRATDAKVVAPPAAESAEVQAPSTEAASARMAGTARHRDARVTTVASVPSSPQECDRGSGGGVEDVRGGRRDAVQAEASQDRLRVGRGVDPDIVLAAVQSEPRAVEQGRAVEAPTAPLRQRGTAPETGEPAGVVLRASSAEHRSL